MSVETIQKLLGKISEDSHFLEQWMESPHDKTKDWSFELDPKVIDALHAALQSPLFQAQQTREVNEVAQNTYTKLNKVYQDIRHSFHANLLMHGLIFTTALAVLILGIYAVFVHRIVEGTVLGVIGLA